MILTGSSVIYITLSVIVLIASGASVVVGVVIARKWLPVMASEARASIEQWGYLVTGIIGVVLLARLFMAPFWFWTLQTLQPMIPGAMCLTGVHLAVYPAAFFASGCKFFIPMAYIYWLTLHALDRQIPSQPFYRMKFYSLIPILLLLSVESYLDLRVLTSIHPLQVNCCTALFDAPSSRVAQVFGQTHGYWAIGSSFCSVAALCSARLLTKTRNFLLPLSMLMLTPSALIVFAIALHLDLSPIILHAPFHHCIFCLWQQSPPVLLASAGYIAGIWLLGAAAIMALGYARVRTTLKPEVEQQVVASCRRLALTSFWCVLFSSLAIVMALIKAYYL